MGSNQFNIKLLQILNMNFIVFWILFLILWGTVPLMIIKGRKDTNTLQTAPSKNSSKKKGLFR